MSRPRWSVIIPAFNEAERLPPYLDAICCHFDGRAEPYEVVVVDDGSSDGTTALVTAGRHESVRVIRFPSNHGKGFAVRAGMLEASGENRLFTDADGATPITEVKRLEPPLAAGADIAIGSRALVDHTVARATRRHRVLAGRVFNWLVERFGLRGIADSQCGFKVFRAAAAEDLFGRLRTTGFGFDVELLMRAQRRGYRIVEVPVNWTDQPGSKIRVLKDGSRMVWEVGVARLRLGWGR